uniref:Bromo domain-containing protein n=1 Tax=Electrophorus electricus TaxID=8005 RepID=A0A4W4FE29_ELEEL
SAELEVCLPAWSAARTDTLGGNLDVKLDMALGDEQLTLELQQAYRIFHSFLLEKHKAITAPFWQSVGPGDQRVQAPRNDMCFKKMDDKFVNREYESITEFVADFRLMLENCYRFHGVDHWISKQAQKLEIMLEQKLTLLSRALREKTSLAVTSRGRFGTEDERGPPGTSSRRRSVPRSLAAITVGGCESIMVQALRMEEQRRAKEDKRQRELVKKEAEEASAKEVEQWEQCLLSLAEPWPVATMWELPAVGHFLCLAQTALNLPEIVFFELERCLLMPRCSSFLAKVMTSLLCQPHRRATLHRRPALAYRRWEAELRRRVLGWYQAVGGAEDQAACAERLGLCHRFFWTLGETSPLEDVAFHLLPFKQRVWLLKGLCDHVYETQKDVQDAVLGQPIHECRESILGYDGQENAYIHFPHFCGADLRIYCQSPCTPLTYPMPMLRVKKLSREAEAEGSAGPAGSLEAKVENGDPSGARLVGGDCYHGKSPANFLGTDTLKAPLPSDVAAAPHNGPPACRDWGPCPGRPADSAAEPESRPCCGSTAAAGRTCSSRPPRTTGVPSRKKKKKKKGARGVAARRPGLKRRGQARAARGGLRKAATSAKRREKRKRKLGEGGTDGRPRFQLQNTLGSDQMFELRDLISKTEDELDDLESTRKRCGRWYSKREAVKDLHITLIRLLNELSPWEPKLIKAFQRNRNTFSFLFFFSECENHLGNESLGCLVSRPEVITTVSDSGPLTRSSKRRQSGVPEENLSPSKKGKMVFNDSVTLESQTEVKSKDQSTAGTNSESTDRISLAAAPIGTFQGRCKPIQALLAKSVGNKVTLISHPQAAAMAGALKLPSKMASEAVPPTKPALSCQPSSQKSPVQVVYKMPEGFSLVKKDGTPVKFPVQPVVDQTTGEKAMQQVIILPSNMLIQRAEEKRNVQPSSITPVSISETATLLSSTPGFTVPENKLAVQQVAPLKDASFVKSPSPTASPIVQKRASCRDLPAPMKTTEPSSTLHRSSTTPSSFSDPNKCDAKQELKTVCIRDSQSILVTTRGGNTGVVKVQTSGQREESALPPSLVYAIPPKFQAFLVPKTSATATSTAQAARTTTTAEPFPLSVNKGTSFKSAPLSPLRCVNPVIPSHLGERTSNTVTQSHGSRVPIVSISGSVAKSPQTLIPVNSITPNPFQSNTSVSAAQVIPQTSAFKSIPRPTQKSSQVSSLVPDQSTFQKVFLVTPTASLSLSTSSITTASAPLTATGSRVMFMSQSASACSTVTILKGSVTSDSSMTGKITSSEAREVRPNLGRVIGSMTAGTPTKVQDMNISGLTASISDKTAVRNKMAPPAEAAIKLESVTVSGVPDTSSGLAFVQNSKPTASSCMPLNIKGPVTVMGSTDDKTVMFSTYGPGHMASSALLSAVQQKSSLMTATVSTSNVPHNRLELVVGSSTPNSGPTLGSLINKDATLLRSLTAEKTGPAKCAGSAPSPVSLPVITSIPSFSQTVTPSTTIAPHISGTASLTPQPVMTSVVSPPVNSNTSTTTVQEKFVISTTAPLAPGTQLLINNTRFVVPAQGLGPGSHVLLISGPALHPAGPQRTSPVLPFPRGPGAPASPGTSGVQGPRMVEPGAQATAQHTPIRLPALSYTHSHLPPAPTTAKAGPSALVNKPLNAVRASLVSTDSTALAQVAPLGTVLSSGQRNLTSILRLPSFLAPEGKIMHGGASCPPKIITVTAQSQRSSPSMATPALLQTGLVPAPPKPSAIPTASPVIPRTSPVVAVPPMSSTVSRLQTLPVATFPPIGGPVNNSLTTAAATVPLPVNTVIMAPCQPVGPLQAGDIRMPVVMTNPPQVQGKGPVQVQGAQTIHTSHKLLLSPDGAILNVLRCPTLQSLPVMANTMTTRMVIPTSDSVTGSLLNTLDPQRILTSDTNAEGPNK